MHLKKVYNGTVCVVTGGASGIGKALCTDLARYGATVISADITTPKKGKLTDEKLPSGGVVVRRHIDISNNKQIKKLIADVKKRYGRIDYFFNNAGICAIGETANLTDPQWGRVIDVNFHGTAYATIEIYREMISQGSGHIVNLSSIGGLAPFSLIASYSAAKFGIFGLSVALGVEAQSRGINVSVVCPGVVQTDIYSAAEMVGINRNFFNDAIPVKGMTPADAAANILRGVAKKKSIIVFPMHAKVIWAMYRLSPNLYRHFSRLIFNRLKDPQAAGEYLNFHEKAYNE